MTIACMIGLFVLFLISNFVWYQQGYHAGRFDEKLEDTCMYSEAFKKAKSAYGTGAYDDATMEFLFPEFNKKEL